MMCEAKHEQRQFRVTLPQQLHTFGSRSETAHILIYCVCKSSGSPMCVLMSGNIQGPAEKGVLATQEQTTISCVVTEINTHELEFVS